MAALDKIKDYIKGNESCDLKVYRDTRGYPTVGWGHKVTTSDNMEVGQEISQQHADDLFLHDIIWLMNGIRQLIPSYDTLPEDVQIAIADMGYNNGVSGLGKFKRFIAAIKKRDWITASAEIVDSDNYRSADLHNRYDRLAQLVKGVA